MKLELPAQPEKMVETWPGEFTEFSWQDFVTAIPSPLFVVTSYKSNGRPNACLQSWSTFVGDGGEFICIIGAVSKRGHLYRSLLETDCCVLNFPSLEWYDACQRTVGNNGDDADEITDSGLTVEPAVSVRAPRIAECFLNIECELLWEREHYAGSRGVTAALRATHIAMDRAHCDDSVLGRYGNTGYLYNIHSPRNPETGDISPTRLGFLEHSD